MAAAGRYILGNLPELSGVFLRKKWPYPAGNLQEMAYP